MSKRPAAVVPAGISLEDGEVIVRSGRDWQASIPLLLTNRRLICPIDPSGGALAVIDLTTVANVLLRKAALGFTSVIVEYGPGRKAAFPMHVNANRVVAEISDAVKSAQDKQSAAAHLEPQGQTGDRYDQLRKLGELRTSGVLTEAEFEGEKARILKQG